MASSTLSFRISGGLKTQLERTARQMSKRKDGVINQALKEYLHRRDRECLRAEARRQSILASKHKWEDADLWEEAAAEVWNDN